VRRWQIYILLVKGGHCVGDWAYIFMNVSKSRVDLSL